MKRLILAWALSALCVVTAYADVAPIPDPATSPLVIVAAVAAVAVCLTLLIRYIRKKKKEKEDGEK